MRAALLLTALLLLVLAPTVPSAAQEPVAVFVEAPAAAGTEKTFPVNVSVVGGPGAQDGLFAVKVFLRGDDLAGAAPLEDAPLERASALGTFLVNVTMPSQEGRVELVVEGNSTKDDAWRTATVTRAIEVLVPITVGATLENTGGVEIRDARAYLLVNGLRVTATEIESLLPGETYRLTFEWLPVGLAPGTHTLEIWVDLDGDGQIDAARGEIVHREVFTKEAEPLNPLFIGLGALGAFAVALFLTAFLRRRRQGA